MEYGNIPQPLLERLTSEKICVIKYSNVPEERGLILDAKLLKRGKEYDISKYEGYQISNYIQGWYDTHVLAPTQRDYPDDVDNQCMRQVKEVLEIFE